MKTAVMVLAGAEEIRAGRRCLYAPVSVFARQMQYAPNPVDDRVDASSLLLNRDAFAKLLNFSKAAAGPLSGPMADLAFLDKVINRQSFNSPRSNPPGDVLGVAQAIPVVRPIRVSTLPPSATRLGALQMWPADFRVELPYECRRGKCRWKFIALVHPTKHQAYHQCPKCLKYEALEVKPEPGKVLVPCGNCHQAWVMHSGKLSELVAPCRRCGSYDWNQTPLHPPKSFNCRCVVRPL